jgi:two-component system cell cycle response regulator
MPKEGYMNYRHKVLIVDDEPLSVKLLAAKLPPDQYTTIRAYNGEEALEKVAEEFPDVILLDIMMPGISGYEVTERLKVDPQTRDIPVILVTALDGTQDKLMGLRVGADEFLNKPVDTAELLARLKSLLRLKEYQEQLKARVQSQTVFTTSTAHERSIREKIDLPFILVVEDSDKDAALIQRYLQEEPYHTDLTRDGEGAISRAQQEEIDLIVLDAFLPGMDGFEVCRLLKEAKETRNIQIIFVTCLLDIEGKIRAIDLGADDFLVKPINADEFRARVKALVKKKAYLDRLHVNYETAVHSAITDKLTGLYNHGYFKHFLELEIKRSARQGHSVALIMIDIDDFKHYNDTLGHLAGDEILKEVGHLIRENIREVDLGVRYGGEEFAVVLPNVDMKGAVKTADRIRQLIHSYSFPHEIPALQEKITVSTGVALCRSDLRSNMELIQMADSALYKAKREGKNRVCIYDKNL